MTVRLLMFAAAREAAGCGRLEVTATSVGEALAVAEDRLGAAFGRVVGRCTIFAGDEAVDLARAWDVPVPDGTEVAVLPPVSGGQGE